MSIQTIQLKNSVRFVATKRWQGERFTKRFTTVTDAKEWLDDLSYLGATDTEGNPTRKAKAAYDLIKDLIYEREQSRTPTLQDCIRLFSKESDIASAPRYIFQLERFTGLLKKPINDIKRLDFEMELDRIQDKFDLKSPTRNRYQAAFSSLFKFLASHKDFKKYSLVNPTTGAIRGKESKGRMLFLDQQQQLDLLSACKSSSWSGLYPLIYLLLLTGSRRNEIARLRWENIDLSEGLITLVKTKNGSDHSVKLPSEAIRLLKEWRLTLPLSNWVFPHHSNPRVPFENFDSHWQKAKQQANMPDGLRIHDLRHTTASTMLLEGYSLEDIKGQLNHKSVMMTNRYAHALAVKDISKKRGSFLNQAI